MFGEIARFLLNTIFTLFGAALLLRAWMQVVRMPPYNPVSNAVMQATNWLVLPLRKILPAAKTIDWASIVAAFLAAVVFVILLVLVAGVDPAGLVPMLPTLLLVAVITVIKWALNLIIWMTILMALLSWLNPQSPPCRCCISSRRRFSSRCGACCRAWAVSICRLSCCS